MTEMEILRLRLYVDYMQIVRCLIEIKNVVFEAQIKAGFNPMQPRVPAGNSDGGQWTESDHVSIQNIANQNQQGLNKQGASHHAVQNIFNPRKHPYGRGQCARKVRESIEAGGVKIPWQYRPAPDTVLGEVVAKDYGRTLEKVGFNVNIRVNARVGYPPIGYQPQIGDVVIIQPILGHPAGHMAMYTGGHGWVSDFIQPRGVWPHKDYQTTKPSYAIYRYPDRVKE